MISSQYILDIFDLAFDQHSQRNLLLKQIPFLTIREIEHTGIGAYIYFSADMEIHQYKLDTNDAINFDIDGNPLEMIDCVEMKNENLSILANLTVHLSSGIIDCIEIFNKCGESYIKSEPTSYELRQVWFADDSKNRSITR